MSSEISNQNLSIFNKSEILNSPFLLDQERISINDVDLPSFIKIDGELTLYPFPKTKIYRIFKITNKTKNLLIKIEQKQKILRITQESFIIFNKKENLIHADIGNKLIFQINELNKILTNIRDLLN